MFATLSHGWRTDGGFLRTSWFRNLLDAIACAKANLGVVAIEEIGVGIVWSKKPNAVRELVRDDN